MLGTTDKPTAQAEVAFRKGTFRSWNAAARGALRAAVSVALVGASVTACRDLRRVDATTTALVLVLIILGIAMRWGWAEAAVAAVAGSLALDYFFLPSYGFGINPPEHLVALLSFLAVAIATGRLSARASRHRADAVKRRPEIERLDRFSDTLSECGDEGRIKEAKTVRRSEDLRSAIFDALAHEARGPLGSIDIAATTLLSERPVGVAQRREMLHIIVEEVDRLNGWIDEAARLICAEAGQFTLHKAPEDVRNLVSGALEPLRPLLCDRRIRIDIPPLLPMAECDRTMVDRILKLLLDNAIKYSPPGSPVTISSVWDDETIAISVADEGPGIPEDEQERVFERGYRGLQNDGSVRGMGLGLASARRLVEAQGGEIRVANRPGGGAVFRFSLPAAIGAAA